MNKVLNRKMFNTPKYEHKSTGIASGLEYRPGYKVGGRVGLHSGGPPHDHPEEYINQMPAGFAGTEDENLPPFNPDASINIAPGIMSKIDAVNESQRLAKLFTKDIPVTDFSERETDFSKFKTDYSDYEPSALGAVTGSAAETLKRKFAPGESQVADFVANLALKSEDVVKTRQELQMMADQDAKNIAMMSEEQRLDLLAKRDEEIKNDAKFQGELQTSLYTDMVNNNMAMAEMDMNYGLALQDIQTRMKIAQLDSDTRLEVQGMISAEMPEKLQIMADLQIPKDQGGQGMSAEDAFATAFGQRDDQIQFAATLLSAFSSGVTPGDDAAVTQAIQRTINTMNLLFPGVFNLTEEDLAGLMSTLNTADTSQMPE